MARMVVIYKRPDDVEAFQRHYFEKHVPLAKRLPGIRKYEVSQGPIMSPAGPSDAWMVRHSTSTAPPPFETLSQAKWEKNALPTAASSHLIHRNSKCSCSTTKRYSSESP